MKNLFEVNFLDFAKKLMKECFSFKKYKATNAFLAVLCGICMLPFVAVFFVIYALYFVQAFLCQLCSSVVKAFHDLVHCEGETVKHGTQVIVYLFGWPLVLLAYVFIIVNYILMVFLGILAQLFARIWTLCGVEWNLLPTNEYKEKVVEGTIKPALPIILVVLFVVILVGVPFLYNYIEYFLYVTDNPVDMVVPYLLSYGLPGALGFEALMSLIGFYFVPKAKKVEEID